MFSAPVVNDRREQVGWYFYDWANSAFYTTVVTVFLGPYLTTITKAAADSQGYVFPLGIPVKAGSFFPYIVSLSVLLEAIVLPLLGAVADYSRLKKEMFGFFAYLGAISASGLYFLQGSNYLLGGTLFVISNVSFGASIVFYNAFLPEIATPDRRDHVSSMAWATGYIGGGLLLALNLLLFMRAESFGLTAGQAVRISLSSAGVWWAIFTLIPLTMIKKRQPVKSLPPGERYITIGFNQLRQTLSKARAYPHTLMFLIAYLIYNDGIQSVILLSSEFGQEELGLGMNTLITVVLMVQFVAFFGNLIFNQIAKWVGAKRAVVISLVIWTLTVCYVYFFLRGAVGFFILG
ncbi:MAG: MFS transporter, partial [Blastocatellia bacterium]